MQQNAVWQNLSWPTLKRSNDSVPENNNGCCPPVAYRIGFLCPATNSGLCIAAALGKRDLLCRQVVAVKKLSTL
jgi:hypothetical protein